MIEQTHTLEANNWLAMRCLEQFTNGNHEILIVPDSSEGLLYVMSSPSFRPVDVPPLGVKAIGSGEAAAEHLQTFRPLLMCAHPARASDVFFRPSGYSSSMASAVRAECYDAHAVDGGVTSLLFSGGDKDIQVTRHGAFFHVHNNATGKEVRLKYPSELVRTPPRASVLFNDFRDAMEADREKMRSVREDLVRRLDQLRAEKSRE
jgi:hypothetical protein